MSTLKYFSCIVLLIFQSISAQNFWQQTNGPYGKVDDIYLTRSSFILAITHSDGIQWSSNNGESWTQIITPYGVSIYGTINDSIFIGGSTEYVYVSNDTGKTWNITGNMRISSLYFEPVSQTIYLGSWRDNGYPCGIFTSTDFGQSWILLYPFPSLNLGQAILELYVTYTNQVILAEEYNGSQYGVGYQLYQSADHGQSWQTIYPVHQFPVSSMEEDIYHNLYVLAANKLLVSEDEGVNWITKSVPYAKVLASDYFGKIYLDLRYSTDTGSSWFNLPNSGFQGGFNDDIEINHSNRIYAASTSGIFYAEADSIVVSVEDIEPAKTFYLSQNYPNPFNPVTSIKYSVSSSEFVTL
ncbi:MAG TPA: hypothetical protein VIY47_12630, partial [Ignavibacteriaceae bacterium]